VISLSTASLYHLPLRATFRLAAEAGFDRLELVMGPEVWLRGPTHVAGLVREFDLPVVTVHQTLLPRAPRCGPGGRMADAAEAAVALAARHVVIHPPAASDWEQPKAQSWLRALESTRRALEGAGTRFALENWGIEENVKRELVLRPIAVLREFALQHDIDITYDTCHAGLEGWDLIHAYDVLRPRVANVHLSNLSAGKPLLDVLLARPLLAEHRLPDDGVLPLRRFVEHLALTEYRGPITCEISPVALRAWSRSGIARQLARCVAFVRKVYERRAFWPA